tara:strand:+ start:131 stop:388 length:258 start_codon:yes stop_codon:yes gene_type:complete
MTRDKWIIEKRKQGVEIYVTNLTTESIFIGEGYSEKEYKRSMKLAQIITKALNDNDPRCHSDEDIYGESNNYNFNLKKRKNKLKN